MPRIYLLLALMAALVLPGCEAIGTIFEVGVWVGALGVVLVLAIIGFVVSRFRR